MRSCGPTRVGASESEASGIAVIVARLGRPSRAGSVAAYPRAMQDSVDAAPLRQHAREAFATMERLGGIEEGEALVRLAYAEALWAGGDREAARRAIEEARARLLARAARLGDEALRGRFLDRVEENARTLALSAAWLGSK